MPIFNSQNRTIRIKFGTNQNTHTKQERRGYLSIGHQEPCAEYGLARRVREYSVWDWESKKKRLRDTDTVKKWKKEELALLFRLLLFFFFSRADIVQWQIWAVFKEKREFLSFQWGKKKEEVEEKDIFGPLFLI